MELVSYFSQHFDENANYRTSAARDSQRNSKLFNRSIYSFFFVVQKRILKLHIITLLEETIDCICA